MMLPCHACMDRALHDWARNSWQCKQRADEVKPSLSSAGLHCSPGEPWLVPKNCLISRSRFSEFTSYCIVACIVWVVWSCASDEIEWLSMNKHFLIHLDLNSGTCTGIQTTVHWSINGELHPRGKRAHIADRLCRTVMSLQERKRNYLNYQARDARL